MCRYNSSGSGHNKVSKLDALLQFWEQFEALWGFIRVTSRKGNKDHDHSEWING